MSEDDAYDLEEALILQYGRKDFESYGTLTNICLGSRPPVTKEKITITLGEDF